jgi:hypothetical protein
MPICVFWYGLNISSCIIHGVYIKPAVNVLLVATSGRMFVALSLLRTISGLVKNYYLRKHGKFVRK